jgi:hypothetical protein
VLSQGSCGVLRVDHLEVFRRVFNSSLLPIVHRQEPDAGNAGYWFRQVGAHPVFPALRERAAEIGVDFGPRSDPIAFINLCERARQEPGSDAERLALETQRAEWQLLFDYCAAKSAGA